MAVTALAWNLEEFGVRFGNNAVADQCENLRCGLVARVVVDAGAQVLVIQELRQRGTQLLDNLVAELDDATGEDDWHYDWIKGSVGRNGWPPATAAQLDWTPTGNREGYAVLYRDGYVNQQQGTRSAGQGPPPRGGQRRRVAPTYYIDLVLSGRQIQFFALNPVIRFVQGAGALPLGFPASTCPDANIIRRLRSRPYLSNSVIPLSAGVRRPCQITIDDPHRGMAAPLSLVVYHAPVGQNNSRSPLYGTLLGFASDALAAAACGYVGDFNVVNGNDLTVLRDRANTLNYGGQTWGAGAYNNTSVHAAIAGAGAGWHSGAGVLTSPRDIGLGTAANSTDVPPVLDWLDVQARPMHAAGNFIDDNRNFIINTLLPLYANNLPANAAQVLNAFYGVGGAAYPPTTDARTGQALIFNLLLSDHLPVRIVQN